MIYYHQNFYTIYMHTDAQIYPRPMGPTQQSTISVSIGALKLICFSLPCIDASLWQ